MQSRGDGDPPRGEADDGADEKLDHGEAQGIQTIAEAVDHKDMGGKEDGAAENDQILRRDGEGGGDGDKEETYRGKSDADPRKEARFFAGEEIEQRDDHHIQRGEKTGASGGIGESGSLKQLDAVLLEGRRAPQKESADDPGGDGGAQDPFVACRIGIFLFKQRDHGEEGQSAERKSDPVEEKGADVITADGLRDKGEPPYNGGQEEKEDPQSRRFFLFLHTLTPLRIKLQIAV